MSRKEIREKIFQLLFRVEFTPPEGMAEQTDLFFADEDNHVGLEEREYIVNKLARIMSGMDRVDRMLDERSSGWDRSRMGKVDLAVLRLAVYEICFDPEIPVGVAINEAVELAKKFGQDNSSAFVNGVLSKFADEKKEDYAEV
ncbi:MAG: transcription antitermination factor NusB [Lachnospiraceae bacterium]|jgi:N utilization substance protein B|nr:transcription antitermination factor NusB [Lachnospiraceae bacterium]